tara:strand:+ start:200 stop:481 length:282 start_codon:yes stop_codon:yes gene_type:complete
MLKKIISTIHLLFVVSLISYIFAIYFSDDFASKININRNDISKNNIKNLPDLPVLKNDTENIINYNLGSINKKKVKKRYFWNLLRNEEKSSNN